MKDIEVHEGLPEKELRDFFANSLNDYETKENALYAEYQSKKEQTYSIIDSTDRFRYMRRAIAVNLLDITHHTGKQKTLEAKLALCLLLTEKGWDSFDISDNTIKTGTGFLSFIGSKEEFAALENKLVK